MSTSIQIKNNSILNQNVIEVNQLQQTVLISADETIQTILHEERKTQIIFQTVQQGLPGGQGNTGPQGPAGPQGPQGQPGAGVVIITDTVIAGNTKVVDSIALTSNSFAIYEISAFNVANFVYNKKTLQVAFIGSNDTQDIVYSKIGDLIDYGIFTNIVSGNIEISIQNNELYDLSLKMLKHVL